MSDRVTEVLQRRVNELDVGPAYHPKAEPQLDHVVTVLQRYTDTFMAWEAGSPAVLDAAVADTVVGTSGLITELASAAPALVRGPLDQQAQIWVGTAKHAGRPPNSDDLRGKYRSVPSAKPWYGTLYTSSASALGPSMWRSYLESYRGSDLHPLPWQVWSLPAAGRVTEVAGARDWVGLIERYPLVLGDLVYPDWDAIAADFDAVHLCLAGVVALQGFSFSSAYGLTAPGYWDIETTHWLRWSFQQPRLIEVVE
jgi:hypothetical protein